MANQTCAPEDDYGVPFDQESGLQGKKTASKFTHDFRRLSFGFGVQHQEFKMTFFWPRIGMRDEPKPEGKQTMNRKHDEERQ